MKKHQTLLTYVTSIFIALFLIPLSVKTTLNFRALYYFDIDFLKIAETSDIPKSEIKENYDALIDYLQTTNKGELKFPTFAMSEGARIHFVDVKNIFVSLDYLMIFSLIVSIIGAYYLIKQKNYLFLKYASIALFAIPIILVIPLAINFNASFTFFHELFFTNDYWLFDPETDPIINVLPEPFFMHNALFILLLITIESFLLTFIFRFIVSRKYKENEV